MADIYKWSATAASNNEEPPAGAPEAMAPSQVNNAMRAIMGAGRKLYKEQLDWRPMGSAGSAQTGDEHAVTYSTVNAFTIGEDASTTYVVNRRLRAVGSSTGTIYGRIAAATTTTITSVTMAWDEQAELANDSNLVVSVGPDPSNVPIDGAAVKDVISADYAYGEVYVESNGAGQSYADNNWALLNMDVGGASGNNGLNRDTTPDEANSKVTVNAAGVYLIEWNGDIKGSASQTGDNLQRYDFQVRVNDVATTPARQARWECGDGNSTVRRHSVALQGIISLNDGDDVSIYARTLVTDAPITLSCVRASLGVKMIDPA